MRQSRNIKVRSLSCFWASKEPEIPHTAMAKRFELSMGNINISVVCDEMIEKTGNYSLIR